MARDPTWPRRLDHNGRRRMFYKLRWDEWEPCVQSGQSIKELLERALTKWQGVERIEDRMTTLGVGHIEIAIALEYIGGFVERISNSPLFKIVLESSHSPTVWLATLGHELGHLEAHQFGSKRLDPETLSRLKGKGLGNPEVDKFLRQSYIEEAFADRFGEAWSAVLSHRRQAWQLFLSLLKKYERWS